MILQSYAIIWSSAATSAVLPPHPIHCTHSSLLSTTPSSHGEKIGLQRFYLSFPFTPTLILYVSRLNSPSWLPDIKRLPLIYLTRASPILGSPHCFASVLIFVPFSQFFLLLSSINFWDPRWSHRFSVNVLLQLCDLCTLN